MVRTSFDPAEDLRGHCLLVAEEMQQEALRAGGVRHPRVGHDAGRHVLHVGAVHDPPLVRAEHGLVHVDDDLLVITQLARADSVPLGGRQLLASNSALGGSALGGGVRRHVDHENEKIATKFTIKTFHGASGSDLNERWQATEAFSLFWKLRKS